MDSQRCVRMVGWILLLLYAINRGLMFDCWNAKWNRVNGRDILSYRAPIVQEIIKCPRERHNQKNKSSLLNVRIKGDVVIMQSDEVMVDELYKGRDGLVRAVKLRARKIFLDRAVTIHIPLNCLTTGQTQNGSAYQPVMLQLPGKSGKHIKIPYFF